MLVAAQAEKLKSQLLAQRAHWRLNGPVTDAHLQTLIQGLEVRGASLARGRVAPLSSLTAMCDTRCPQSANANGRGVALDRRRFGDDSDSDIDLDGL